MRRAAASLLLPLVLASCFVVRHDYDGSKQLTPGTRLRSASEPVATIQGSKVVPYLLFGFIRLGDASGPRLAASLAEERVGPEGYDGIVRLHIQDQEYWVGTITKILTLGLFGIYEVEVDGVVHRFSGGGT